MKPFGGFEAQDPRQVGELNGMVLRGWWSFWDEWQSLVTIDAGSGENRISQLDSLYGGPALVQPTDALRHRFWDVTCNGYILPRREPGRASYLYTTDATLVALGNAPTTSWTVMGVSHATGANFGVCGWENAANGHYDRIINNSAGVLSASRYDGVDASTQTLGDGAIARMSGPVAWCVFRMGTIQETWIDDSYLGSITHTSLTLANAQFRTARSSLTTADQHFAELIVFAGVPTPAGVSDPDKRYRCAQRIIRGMRAKWSV